MDWPGFPVALAGSYLIGSVPTGYLLVRWVKRIDVRAVGSGNVGATNVARAAGAAAGLLVLALDLGKGLLAVLGLAPGLIHPVTPAAQLACGLAAVIGHCAPVFLKFQGGKGVATTMGVIVGVSPSVAAACLGVWGVVFALCRYVSVASLAAAAAIPVAQAMGRRPGGELLVGVVLALVIIVRHHANIARLMRGTEPPFGARMRGSRDS
jgi:glycerol-3-phosphate acyltransferase PlsY